MSHVVEGGPYRSADPEPPVPPGPGWPEIVLVVAAFLGVYFVASAWNRMTNDGALPEVDVTASPQLVVPPPRREQIEIVIWLPPGSRLTLSGQTFLAVCSHTARCGCSYQLLLPICPSSN